MCYENIYRVWNIVHNKNYVKTVGFLQKKTLKFSQNPSETNDFFFFKNPFEKNMVFCKKTIIFLCCLNDDRSLFFISSLFISALILCTT